MLFRKLIITSILKKKNQYYKQVDYLPRKRVPPILQIRLVLRYFSLFNLNFCNMYRISV